MVDLGNENLVQTLRHRTGRNIQQADPQRPVIFIPADEGAAAPHPVKQSFPDQKIDHFVGCRDGYFEPQCDLPGGSHFFSVFQQTAGKILPQNPGNVIDFSSLFADRSVHRFPAAPVPGSCLSDNYKGKLYFFKIICLMKT